MPLLFRAQAGTPIEAPLAALDTPLGVLEFDAVLGSQSLAAVPVEAFRVARLETRFAWAVDHTVVELLLRPWARPQNRGAASVTDCWAAVFRVYAEAPTPPIELSCVWQAGAVWHRADGPQSGEALEAQTWSDGHTVVAIGTADADALATGSDADGISSARWRDRLASNSSEAQELVQYSRAGFRLRLPALETGERAQAHFLIAWGPEQPDDIGPWLAVDARPAAIAHALNT